MLCGYERLKAARPELSIVTCHDEFLLPTLLEGADGALVGFAGFAPELIVQMVSAALDGDLVQARIAQQQVAPLARLIYNFGEPGCGAHQRMKVARWLLRKFPSPISADRCDLSRQTKWSRSAADFRKLATAGASASFERSQCGVACHAGRAPR